MNAIAMPAAPIRSALWVGCAVLAVFLLLMRDTGASMVSVWMRSSTFTHAFIVPPIALWLIWRQRQHLQGMVPKPAAWILGWVALACLGWLVGEVAEVNALTHVAFVALIVLSVPLLFGTRITHEILFPLLFLFFAAPLGDFMVPWMMTWTADFTVWALKASGVPVYREGLQFIIPSGRWSVVEACSGIRYLIASFMVGALFAYLNYRSPKRRAVFMLLALLVPIVANWLRAYMIVMIGHLSSNQLAVGADHLIYGWVFFGVVIAALFMIGARWTEPDLPLPATPAPVASTSQGSAGPAMRPVILGTAFIAMVVATQALLWKVDHAIDAGPPRLSLSPSFKGGWNAEPSFTAWTPSWKPPRVEISQAYRSGDQRVGLWLGYYGGQNQEGKLVSSMNHLAKPDDHQWSEVSNSARALDTPSGPLAVRATELRAVLPDGNSGQRLMVWRLYWVDGQWLAGDAATKLTLAWNRLRGKGDDGAGLLLFTEYQPNDSRADAALEAFARDALPQLSGQLAAVRRTASGPGQ